MNPRPNRVLFFPSNKPLRAKTHSNSHVKGIRWNKGLIGKATENLSKNHSACWYCIHKVEVRSKMWTVFLKPSLCTWKPVELYLGPRHSISSYLIAEYVAICTSNIQEESPTPDLNKTPKDILYSKLNAVFATINITYVFTVLCSHPTYSEADVEGILTSYPLYIHYKSCKSKGNVSALPSVALILGSSGVKSHHKRTKWWCIAGLRWDKSELPCKRHQLR